MDTMFSDYELTASRLADLLTSEEDEYADKILDWFEADQRPASSRRNYYRATRAAIDELHRRSHRIEDLRERVNGWRLDALAGSTNQNVREQFNHNVRATTQYLDEHGERQMTVFKKQRFEPVVARVRVVVAPHLFVHTDAMPMRIWIDCAETLRESLLVAKCNVTLWAARAMRQSAAQVEVIHSATKRIVARGVLPPRFDQDVLAACELVHRGWERLRHSAELRPESRTPTRDDEG